MQGFLGRMKNMDRKELYLIALLKLICGACYASLLHISASLTERNILCNYLNLKMATIFINENLKNGKGVMLSSVNYTPTSPQSTA